MIELNDRDRFFLSAVNMDYCRKKRRASLKRSCYEKELADVLSVIEAECTKNNSAAIEMPRLAEHDSDFSLEDCVSYVRWQLTERGFICGYSDQLKMLAISW